VKNQGGLQGHIRVHELEEREEQKCPGGRPWAGEKTKYIRRLRRFKSCPSLRFKRLVFCNLRKSAKSAD
jgi:hypothetical protein